MLSQNEANVTGLLINCYVDTGKKKDDRYVVVFKKIICGVSLDLCGNGFHFKL